jgi:DNA repair exonuclease SbcCD ATPase subunit
MFSYGESNTITLNSNRITQLSAPNGAGKTSISLILQELLYNKNVKKLNKSEILNTSAKTKQWSGSIEFSVNDNEYYLSVVRKNNTSTVKLLENGVDISEHKILDTYKRIHSIIGRDFEVFSQLTYQSSTNLLEFLKATDSNRKKFLISLFNLEKYLSIGDKIKLDLGAKDRELAVKQAELRTINDFIEKNKLPEKGVEIEEPSIDSSLQVEISKIQKELDAQLDTYKRIDKNNLLVKERDSLVFDMAMPEPEVRADLTEDIDKYKHNISSINTKLSEIKRRLGSLDTSEICYACNQPLDNSQSKKLAEQLNSEYSELQNSLKEEKTRLNECISEQSEYAKLFNAYEKNVKAKDKFVQLSQLIDQTLPSEYPDYGELKNSLDKLTEEYKAQVDANDQAKKYNESIRIRNAKIDGLVDQIIDFKARQQLVQNDILKIQDEINSLTILKKAFSTSGIVAYKLENVAKQLEESINYYLSMLSDGQFQIIFRLSGEKLNIVVINNGNEVSIDSLSGGEFSRVQTSVLLAVRNTLSKIGSNSINLLFLDEITGVLDEVGKEKLFEVLQEETELNVFLISHDYSHPLIPRIEINKTDNISYIAS